MTAGSNPSGEAIPEVQYRPGPAPQPIEPPTTPLHVAPEHVPAQAQPTQPQGSPAPQAPPAQAPPPQPQATPLQTASFAAGGDQCPHCGTHMAIDQRYCLECGQRRGDPRLPFMDAVVFMDSVKQPQGGAAAAPPPPPREQKSRMSANASLIAGVATLVLAIGVGVLIGRTGESDGSTAANTPQVIKVEGGGGGGTETESSAESSGKVEKDGAESSAGGSGKKGKGSKDLKEAENEQAAESVLKTNPDVNLPPPTVEKGGKCEPGQAGCSGSGEFDGSFFGE